MSITKANVQSRYTVITNATAQHKRLSLEAKGLILLISSRPEDWVFHKTQLMAECFIGRDKLNRLFKELECAGHLSTTQNFDKLGRFSENEYIFFSDNNDNPAFINLPPLTEKPLTEKPLTENHPLQKKDLIQKKDNTNCDSSDLRIDGFYEFYKSYPKKKSKPAAQRAFNAKTKSLNDDDFMLFVDKLISDPIARYKKTDIQFIPHPSTYLNQECYNDEF